MYSTWSRCRVAMAACCFWGFLVYIGLVLVECAYVRCYQ